LLPNALCFVANAHYSSTRPDQISPKTRIIILPPALDSRRLALHAKPALVDFVMAKLDRFAD